jgi:hypothetical protein
MPAFPAWPPGQLRLFFLIALSIEIREKCMKGSGPSVTAATGLGISG